MKRLRIDPGVLSALSAGVLFGASTPLAKRLVHGVDPWMLAGLLYLGSGLGLGTYQVLRQLRRGQRANHASVRGADGWWLAAAITAGALLLSVNGSGLVWTNAVGPAAIAAACLAWALDNNFTRKVALNDVTQIAMLKGLVAGSVNVAIAAALGRSAPFAGALIAVAFFGDPFTIQLIACGALMIIGLWLHLSEQHDHVHSHAPLIHTHLHVHDAHHQHEHDAAQASTEPHAHRHEHAPLRHVHPHFPDGHHQHEH